MTLVPKSGGFLKIRTIKDYAIDGTATQLYGAQVYVELLNTPIGDMVLGERDLEAEPMNLETHERARTNTIPLYHGLRAPPARSRRRKPTKTLLMAIGVGKQCEGKESKKAGCCPPKNALTRLRGAAGKLPAGGTDRRLPHQQRPGAVRRAGRAGLERGQIRSHRRAGDRGQPGNGHRTAVAAVRNPRSEPCADIQGEKGLVRLLLPRILRRIQARQLAGQGDDDVRGRNSRNRSRTGFQKRRIPVGGDEVQGQSRRADLPRHQPQRDRRVGRRPPAHLRRQPGRQDRRTARAGTGVQVPRRHQDGTRLLRRRRQALSAKTTTSPRSPPTSTPTATSTPR